MLPHMVMNPITAAVEPARAEIDGTAGAVMIEFGAAWCGYCRAAQAHIAEALADYPHVRHIKVEDGKGRRLGRSFRIRLWPTLVLLRNGKELARVVRPGDAGVIRDALAALD
ncbi:MAG TPA: thioredoxin family protein [Methylophilaceae bacterium]|nr:thioredoxin family protein [Methylophilaceae bacterium]